MTTIPDHDLDEMLDMYEDEDANHPFERTTYAHENGYVDEED